MKPKSAHIVRMIMTLFLLVSVALISPLSTGAGEPGTIAQQTGEPLDGTRSAGAGVQNGAGSLGLFQNYSIHGGYVAKGTGMRNTGYGFIPLNGIPSGATVHAAFLYWNVLTTQLTRQQLKTFARATFDGHAITGSIIGRDASPCWYNTEQDPAIYTYSYRAPIPTSYITGNRPYTLTGFHSGKWQAEDPWGGLSYSQPTPMMEGATLVVVFERADYPLTTIQFYDGAATIINNPVTLTMSGFTATNPVGIANTTFIGADGQDSAKQGSSFNGTPLPDVAWSGGDPKFGPASHGTLWDTMTVPVNKLMHAGDTSAQVRTEIGAGNDCLVWEAQIFSLSDGTADSDGDGLLDGWEVNPYNGMDLQSMGADPFHKDIFVEVDWMGETKTHASHKPDPQVISRAQTMFASAPVNNPDGKKGINLHVDTGQWGGGNEVPHIDNLGTMASPTDYSWKMFQTLKDMSFNPARSKVFHYVVFAHQLAPELGTTSGIARGIPSSDFIVSLGGWTNDVGSVDEQTGTFVHELGHNLGLRHGGNDDDNWKPNYVSVMNYAFQVTGLRRNGVDGVWNYSWTSLPSLNENALDETVGLNGGAAMTGYGTKYYCWNAGAGQYDTLIVNNANGPIDWNCNGSATQTSAVHDINGSGTRTVLGTQNNWANIVFDGGLVGPGAKLQAEPMATNASEMKYEDAHPASQGTGR